MVKSYIYKNDALILCFLTKKSAICSITKVLTPILGFDFVSR